MLCLCQACGWSWRDLRPAMVRAGAGCARCGEPWGRRYRAWDGRDTRTGRRSRPTAEVWQMPASRGRWPRSA